MKLSIVRESAVAALVALHSVVIAVVAVSFTHGNLNELAFGVLFALFVLGVVLAAVAQVAGMVATARLHRWDWFVAVLLLGAPAALALGLMQGQIADQRRSALEVATL
jgi:hypothetical protein